MKDYAVEEIRARRRRLIEEKYGGSIDCFVDKAVSWSKEHPDRVENLRRKRKNDSSQRKDPAIA